MQYLSADDLRIAEELAKREARKGFWAYRQFLNPAMLKGWWQREIARELMGFWVAMQAGLRPILLIQAPPQHGKSRQIVEFVSWVAGQNPDLKTIYASFSDDLGVRANRDLQRIFDRARYRGAFPGTFLNGKNVVTVSGAAQRNSTMLEFVNREGFFRNTTVEGQITGQGLDLGVIDDPIKGRAAANSITTRNKVWEWLADDFMTRLSKDAGVLGIMTRWHVDDPFGRLIERMGNRVKVVSFPAIAEVDEPFRRKGEALFPAHKPLDFLLERKMSMIRTSWESLYQQNPTIAEGGMFKRDDWRSASVLPLGCKIVRAWDLAATAEPDAAATAGVLMAIAPDNRVFILDVVRVQQGPGEVHKTLKRTAEADRAKYGAGVIGSIPQDPGQAGKVQAHALLTGPLFGMNYSASPENGDKELRAMPLAAQVEAGNVYLLPGDWHESFKDEAASFPNGKFKDQVDAASRAFGELLPSAKRAGTLF